MADGGTPYTVENAGVVPLVMQDLFGGRKWVFAESSELDGVSFIIGKPVVTSAPRVVFPLTVDSVMTLPQLARLVRDLGAACEAQHGEAPESVVGAVVDRDGTVSYYRMHGGVRYSRARVLEEMEDSANVAPVVGE